MKITIFPFLIAVLFAATTISCDKDDAPDPDPDPEPKEEQIATYLKMVFKPVGDTLLPPAAYPYVRVEIEDGRSTRSSTSLRTNRAYDVSVVLEDRRLEPIKDITQLIASKADQYQLFIKAKEELIVFEAQDVDSKGLPIGLQWRATVKETQSFFNSYEITIIDAPGTKNGTSTVGKKVFQITTDQSIL